MLDLNAFSEPNSLNFLYLKLNTLRYIGILFNFLGNVQELIAQVKVELCCSIYLKFGQKKGMEISVEGETAYPWYHAQQKVPTIRQLKRYGILVYH